jgi:uncharacterized membrane protein YbhN (UPF0104 family)
MLTRAMLCYNQAETMKISKKVKALLSLCILTLSVGFVVYFFIKHPTVFAELKQLRMRTVLILLALDALGLLILAFMLSASLELCSVKIPKKDGLIVTAYTSIINFFGPLQSGPAFRVVYLKKRHDVPVKKYIFTNFIYYGFYAILSAAFLCIHILPWWQTALVLIMVAVLVALVLKNRSAKSGSLTLRAKPLILIGFATLAQIVVQTATYFTELHVINPHISMLQTITYTGAANFALFVSLTPGAIGFRESFLIFSQHLHHINTSTIIAANVIDRAVYVLFLLLLAIPIIGLHAKEKVLKKQRIKEG